MADFKNYITARGFKRLQDELRYLRLIVRPGVVDEVARAAAMGDRSENAEYIYGKKRLREIDRRLRWLFKRLGAAEVVEGGDADRGDRVFFGATITVGYPDGAEKRFELVGQDEIESERGRISWRSPLGKALMRRREGDIIEFRHLDTSVEIEIVEVEYLPLEPDPPSKWDLARKGGKIDASAADAPMEPSELGDDDDDDDDPDPT